MVDELTSMSFIVLLPVVILMVEVDRLSSAHGLSHDLETGCPNRDFIDFWVSKVWYKIHTTNEINPIYIYRFCFVRPVTALIVL